MKKTLLSRLSTAALLVAATFIAQPTDTKAQFGNGGFDNSGDTTHLGMLNAGNVASTDNAAALFNNPGAIVRVPGNVAAAGGVILNFGSGSIRNTGGTTTPVGAVVGSNNAGDPLRTNVLYGAAAIYKPNEHIGFAFGVYNPWLLDMRNDRNSFLRFNNNNVKFDSFAVKPAVSFAPTDNLSVGVSVDITYGRGEFSRAKMLPAFLGGSELDTNFVGHDWAFDIDFGFLYEVGDWGFGFNYSSGTTFALKGNYRVTSNTPSASGNAATNALLTAAGLTSAAAFTDWHVPDSYNFGVLWEVMDNLHVGAQVGVTRWSVFDQLKTTNQFTLPGSSFGVIPAGTILDFTQPKLDTTWDIAVGAEYSWGDLDIQVGYAYEESPIDPNFADTMILGGDTNVLAVGLSYAVAGLNFNVSYAHGFVDNENINFRQPTTFGVINPNASGANPVRTIANVDTNYDALALNFSFNF